MFICEKGFDCVYCPKDYPDESCEHWIEVVPARYGQWIIRGGKRYCSVCGDRACVTRDTDDFWYTVGTKYCPSCGADMRERNAEK